ncbi:N-acylneuraminate cytidylyltransferase [Frankliniella fusca]|uniref:N-acylneuraminate cytidylyltransferase n=1 Tax=Frankliniella fusca TaxID=407009 RepID=A0AAE1HW32_9NEOP|nr:N-acylneuraminate cytidylyltransferase [Frankliniella fusca]
MRETRGETTGRLVGSDIPRITNEEQTICGQKSRKDTKQLQSMTPVEAALLVESTTLGGAVEPRRPCARPWWLWWWRWWWWPRPGATLAPGPPPPAPSSASQAASSVASASILDGDLDLGGSGDSAPAGQRASGPRGAAGVRPGPPLAPRRLRAEEPHRHAGLQHHDAPRRVAEQLVRRDVSRSQRAAAAICSGRVVTGSDYHIKENSTRDESRFNVSKSHIAGLILARCGSKGIPMKNLAKIGSESLLKRTITTLQLSRRLSSIWVATDCNIIAEEALVSGASVFRRSPQSATDTAPSILAVKEFLSLNPGSI